MPKTRLIARGAENISYRKLRRLLRRKDGETTVVAMYKRGARNIGVMKIDHQSDIRTVERNSEGDAPYFTGVIWCASTVAIPSSDEYEHHAR